MRKIHKSLQNRLTDLGGKRLNGEPIYKFVWSADFTYKISNGMGYEPFRVVAEDAWLLVKWEPADFWGTQEEWERNNWEPGSISHTVNGIVTIEPLYTAGPYPREGRYRVIMRVMRRLTMENGERYYAHVEPNFQWIEEFFPGVRDFLNLSTEEKSEHITKRMEAERKAVHEAFAKSRENYRGIATSKQVADQIEKIENWAKDPVAVAEAAKIYSGDH